MLIWDGLQQQQRELGIPDIPSSNFHFQLGDPKALPGQMGCLIPRASSIMRVYHGIPSQLGMPRRLLNGDVQESSSPDAQTTTVGSSQLGGEVTLIQAFA